MIKDVIGHNIQNCCKCLFLLFKALFCPSRSGPQSHSQTPEDCCFTGDHVSASSKLNYLIREYIWEMYLSKMCKPIVSAGS